MKIIENKPTTIQLTADQSSIMSYFDLLKLIINQPSQEGYNVEQMRQRLNIWGTIDTGKDNKSVKFELNDFTILKDSINKFKWAQPHKDIVEFVDYINAL